MSADIGPERPVHLLERLSDENDNLTAENRRLRLELANTTITTGRLTTRIEQLDAQLQKAEALADHQSSLLDLPTAPEAHRPARIELVVDWTAPLTRTQLLHHLDDINAAWRQEQGY